MTTFSVRSFVAGACSAFLFLSVGYMVQEVQANQASKTVGPTITGMEPIVPPLTNIQEGLTIGVFDIQPLDGINCIHCIVQAAVITYAGGMFNCIDCKIKATQVQLKGAALNTYNALVSFGMIPKPQPAQPPTVQKDPVEKAKFDIHPGETVKWVSLEGGK